MESASGQTFRLGVTRLANQVEQFTLHVENDVNIDGAVECLDGVSNLLRGAFDSRTRDAIFKDEQGVRDVCVLHELRNGPIVKGVATGLFIAKEHLAVFYVFESVQLFIEVCFFYEHC